MKALISFSRKVSRLVIGKSGGEFLVKLIFKLTDANVVKVGYREMGILNFADFKVSGEDFFLQKIVKPNLLECDSIYDIGANIGNYTKNLQRIFPKNRIHSVEPNPSSYKVLKNVNRSSFNIAISKLNGDLQFYTSESNQSSEQASFSIESIPANEIPLKIKVKSISLAELIKITEPLGIGLVKVDVEGYERDVFESGIELIPQFKFVQFEFNEKHTFTRTFLKDFHELFGDTHHLYRLHEKGLIDITKYHPTLEIFRYQNIVGINKSMDLDVKKFYR